MLFLNEVTPLDFFFFFTFYILFLKRKRQAEIDEPVSLDFFGSGLKKLKSR